MSKSKIAILSLIVIILVAVFFLVTNNGGKAKVTNLVKSNFQQIVKQKPIPTPSSIPQTVSNNPPKSMQFDQGTDLQKELDSINPEVLNSDFQGL